jgi:chromosomal replication initiator protein
MAVTAVEQAAQGVWARVTEKARGELPESSFTMWFSEVRPASLAGDVLELSVPSEYVRDWLTRHYLPLIQSAASEAVGSPLRVHVVADPEAARQVKEPTVRIPEAGPTIPAASEMSRALLPFPDRYTFDAFVPGPSNRFAHAAAMAVAEARPSKAYNPLFIYGGVGLGKTHLLFATGHHMIRLMPGLRVKYVTSETFVTEFIKAVRERQGYQFQRRYRDVDVLLVDDIQFLARREETQTEFFHTFNALHEAERQIVIASDRPPQELSGMEERLRNRFRWGLCVDVQPPDLETRIAILQLKAQRDKISVPNEVLDFIASKFDQNIRELEGALLRAAAFSSLTGQPIDTALAERALADLLPQNEIEIPAALIVDETAAYFGLTRNDLVSKNRSRPLTTARHIAMYLLRETTSLSLIKIGEMFDRDHSTALHGIRKVETDMSARGSTFRQVQDLTRTIRSRVRGA